MKVVTATVDDHEGKERLVHRETTLVQCTVGQVGEDVIPDEERHEQVTLFLATVATFLVTSTGTVAVAPLEGLCW